MTTLVVTAVAAERDAVTRDGGKLRRLGPYDVVACGDLLVVAGGVGPPAAAAAAATVAALEPLDLLVSAGIGGGFAAAGVGVGHVVLASRAVHADLGAQIEDEFLDLAALGFGDTDVPTDLATVAAWRDRLTADGLQVVVGPVITLSAMTGTDIRTDELYARHAPVAEAMEGAAVAHVAELWQLPFCEVRTISNEVGARDPSQWDLGGALAQLRRVASVLWP